VRLFHILSIPPWSLTSSRLSPSIRLKLPSSSTVRPAAIQGTDAVLEKHAGKSRKTRSICRGGVFHQQGVFCGGNNDFVMRLHKSCIKGDNLVQGGIDDRMSGGIGLGIAARNI